jgi:hypothetical protein
MSTFAQPAEQRTVAANPKKPNPAAIAMALKYPNYAKQFLG